MYKTYSYILSENISGYGAKNKKPIGFCKIKCFEDKNTVDLNIRNIDTRKNKYNCYLIYFKDKYYGVNIGEANVSGENNICMKKVIDEKSKITSAELKGFAITNESEENKAIMYGCNDEINFWDGLFVENDRDEEIGDQDVWMSGGQGVRDSGGKDVGNLEEQENIEAGEQEIRMSWDENVVESEEQEDIEFGMDANIRSDNRETLEEIAEEEFLDENEHQKIHMDALIHKDRFRWDVFNNIFLYISYKKYGYVFYMEKDDKCKLAIPVEQKYIKTVEDRYKYIKADNKEYDGYILIEW